jgi:hypothetical protein
MSAMAPRANPFDAFDTAAPAPVSGARGNPFDQFDPPPEQAPPPAYDGPPVSLTPFNGEPPMPWRPLAPQFEQDTLSTEAPTPKPVPLGLGERLFGNLQEGFSHTLLGAIGNFVDVSNQRQIVKNLREQGQFEAADRYEAGIGVPGETAQKFQQGDAWNAEGTSFGEKLVRGGTSLLGQLFGMGAMSPEGMINKVPGVTDAISAAAERGLARVIPRAAVALTNVAPRAAIATAQKVAPPIARTAATAATQGTIFGAANVPVQVANIGAGKQESFDPWQVGETALMGAMFGTGVHLLGELAGPAKTAVSNAFQDWRIKRDIARLGKAADEYGPPTREEAAAFALTPEGRAVREAFEPKAEATPIPPPAEYRTVDPQAEPAPAPVPQRFQAAEPRAEAPASVPPEYRPFEPQAEPVPHVDPTARAEPPLERAPARPVEEAPPAAEAAPEVPAAPVQTDLRGRPIEVARAEPAPATDLRREPVAEAPAQPEPKIEPEAQPAPKAEAEAAPAASPKGWETNPITESQATPHATEAPAAKPPEAPAAKVEAPAVEAPKVEAPAAAPAPAAKVAKPGKAPKVTGSHTIAAKSDGEGRFGTDDAGHVLSERGTPVKFGTKDQAGKWIDKKGAASDQGFKIVKHPTERGTYSVQARKPLAKETPAVGAAEGAKAEAVAPSPGKSLPPEAPATDHATEQAAIDSAVKEAQANGQVKAANYDHAPETGQSETASAVEEGPPQSSGADRGTERAGDDATSESDAGAASRETSSAEPSGGASARGERVESTTGPDGPGSEKPAGGTRKGRARPKPKDVDTPKGKKKQEAAKEAEAASDKADAENTAELEAALTEAKDAPGGTPKEKVAANLKTRNEFYASPGLNPQLWADLADTLVKVFGWTFRGAKEWVDNWARDFEELGLGLPSGKGAVEKFNNLTRPIRRFAEIALKDKDGVLRGEAIAHKSPTMRKVADLFHAATEGMGARVKGAKAEDYHSAKFRWEAKWKDRYGKATKFARTIKDKTLREDTMKQIGKLVQNPRNIVRGTEIGDAAYEITEILKEAHTYLREAGVPVGTVREGYLPRIENTEEILARPTEFEAKATQAYIASGYGKRAAATAAKDWLNRVINGDYGLNPDGMPIPNHPHTPSNFTKSRTLSKQADVIMDDFFHQNVDEIIPRYVNQAVGRAEWSRRFGMRDASAVAPSGLSAKEARAWHEDPNGKWKDILDEMIAEGNGELIGDLSANVRAMTGGVGPVGNYGNFKRGAVWLRTINILGKLSYSVVSSLTEPITHAVQTGNTLDAIRGYTGLIQHWVPLLKKIGNGEYLAELSADLNIIGNHWDESTALGLTGGDSGSRTADKLVSKFFKLTGQAAFTDASRKTAVGIGQVFFRRLAKSVNKGDVFAGSSRKILMDFGIRDPDGFAKYVVGLDKPTAAEMFAGGQHGEDYAAGLRRYVQRTVMHPTGAFKPYYADNPTGSLFFALTSFQYAFKKQVLDRAVLSAKDAFNPNSGLNAAERAYALMPAMNLVPMAMASYGISEIRDELLPDPTKDPDRPMGDGVKWVRAISRMGGFGYADPWINAYAQARYQTDVGTAIAGAILGPIGTAMGAGIDYSKEALFPDEDAEESNTKSRKASASAWDVVVRPTLQVLLTSGAPVPWGVGRLAATGLTYALADRRVRAGFIDAAGGEKDE